VVLLAISHVVPPYPVGLVLLAIATFAFHRMHAMRTNDEAWDAWYLERFGTLLRDHERGEWEELGRGRAQAFGGRRRRKTMPALPGAFYFLLGTTISCLLYPTVAARTSLLVLSVADPAAGLVGSFFWEYLHWNVGWDRLLSRIRGRAAPLPRMNDGGHDATDEGGGGGPSVVGSVACAIATVLCTYAYIPPPTVNDDDIMRRDSTDAISLSLGLRLGVGMITAATEAVAGRRLRAIGMRLPDDNLMMPLVVGGMVHCWAE
jgi:dolichol kinase